MRAHPSHLDENKSGQQQNRRASVKIAFSAASEW